MIKKWFAPPLVIIVFLASYFVPWLIGSELYTQNIAILVMATFTIVLAAATIWNGKITQDLLKQSEEASKQAKRALENSIFREIVSPTLQLNAILRNDRLLWDKRKRTPYIKNFAAGMLITLKNIDPIMFEKISEAIKTWNKTDSRTPATIFLKALEMVEKYQKTKKKELT